MKLQVTGLIALLIFASCALQTVSFTESEYYTDVIDASGTKEELYLRANEWFVSSFGSAESVIQHSDKQEGVILGKYLMFGEVSSNMYASVDTRVYAVIDIRLKDNKARIEIKPQGQWKYDASGITIEKYSKEKAKADMYNAGESFRKAIKKEPKDF